MKPHPTCCCLARILLSSEAELAAPAAAPPLPTVVPLREAGRLNELRTPLLCVGLRSAVAIDPGAGPGAVAAVW